MKPITKLHDAIFAWGEAQAWWLVPSLARFIFASILAGYFWTSAMTKVGDGILGFLSPSLGAYAQIFPRQMASVSYDISQLGTYHWAVVTAGTLAEFILPALLIIGLLTRLSAVGMIGFIVVQSLTDVIGHGADAETIGRWFDRFPDGLIVDQRALWVFVLGTLVLYGAGPVSADRLLRR
ncbi:MAG: DoxX family membrane protein [Paracoccaceae bacterium]|nr:DoxX family membrane protein [Paracoccaceae bacterium]